MFDLCCLLFLALACIYLMPLPARGPHYSTKSLDKVYDVSGTEHLLPQQAHISCSIFSTLPLSRLWSASICLEDL